MKRKLNEDDIPTPLAEMQEPHQAAQSPVFETLGLDSRLLQAIAREGLSKPTPVQAQVIPLALEGKDVSGEPLLTSFFAKLLLRSSSKGQDRIRKDLGLCFTRPRIDPTAEERKATPSTVSIITKKKKRYRSIRIRRPLPPSSSYLRKNSLHRFQKCSPPTLFFARKM